MMPRLLYYRATQLVVLLCSSLASAAIVEHVFQVKNVFVKPLCKEQMIPAVNGSLPGPTINVREGDTLVVHVINNSTYNITIHWHGVFQRNSWMDGVGMITQCPIQPSNNLTYRFQITGQEGTLFWHAHILSLRATVYGALIIRPRFGRPYPFPKPYKEIPLIFGQWWDMDIGLLEIRPAPVSDAYLINGLAGDSYHCSKNRMFNLKVVQGKTYLLRIINAALQKQLFFKIANHNVTVVAVDALYTMPYITDVMMLTSGQTLDALFTADQTIGMYYISISSYNSASQGSSNPPNTISRGLIIYEGATLSSSAIMPLMPEMDDVSTAYKFSSNITSLVSGPHWTPVPHHIDEKMFITMGLGLESCQLDASMCHGNSTSQIIGSLNNRSFVLPKTISLQEAYFYNITGVYTDDFPNEPPLKFDYANFKNNTYSDSRMMFPEKRTSVKILKFNSTVEIVLQSTGIVTKESHPMHLHGFNFYVLGYGLGNYDSNRDARKLNLVNPQMHNTVSVPQGGWVVLRFIANSPGAWMFHCHMDIHLRFGMIMAFIVQNGPTPETSLLPPPLVLPQCTRNLMVYESPSTNVDLSS